MTPKNTGFRPESLRLIAAALALHQAERIATSITPLPGTDRFIAIGTPAEVARLLEIAPGAQEVTQQAAEQIGQHERAHQIMVDAVRDLVEVLFKARDWLGSNPEAVSYINKAIALAGIRPVTQQAAKADPILATWPERIWLQCNPDEREEYPGMSEDLTWCAANIHASDVEYVRADLAPTTSTVSAPVQKLFDAFEKGAAPFKVEVALDQLEIEEVQIGIDPIYLRDIFADAGLIEVRCTAAQAAADKSED